MAKRQFHFSFFVGCALALLGVLILSREAVGFSLIALGATIIVLALINRGAQYRDHKVLAPSATPGSAQG